MMSVENIPVPTLTLERRR